jgi:adenosylcobinamide-GDP ribazoletransferase
LSNGPLAAIRGAVAFLTRLPVGGGEAAWDAFRERPHTIPLVGYLIGGIAGLAFFLPVQPTTVVAAYLVVLYGVTGITHADGLADVGDAMAVHGDRERRREVLKDSATGVGGTVLLGLTLIVLTLGALGFAGTDAMTSFRLVIAAEVGAKLGMVLVICYGRAAHEGLGSQLVDRLDRADYGPAVLVVAPAILLAPGGSTPALLGAVVAGPLVGAVMLTWGYRALGGVNGDVIGATNELARAVGLHLGVAVWIVF